MPKQTGFRVLGEVLGREDSFLDVEVGGVDENGHIYLQESQPNGEEWRLTAEEIAELADELLLVGLDNIPFPSHEIWNTLDTIGQNRKVVDFNNFVDNHIRDAQESLFKAIIEAGR